jgi:hypothetical protein
VNGWNLEETVEHLRKEAVVGLIANLIFPPIFPKKKLFNS